jgi:hypothetical protein
MIGERNMKDERIYRRELMRKRRAEAKLDAMRTRPKKQKATEEAPPIDLTTFDPVAVLKTIAADVSAPAAARVSAAKTLLADMRAGSEQPDEHAAHVSDAVSRRALKLLAAGGRA